MKQSNQLFHYVDRDGVEQTVRQGIVVPDNHPAVKGHEPLFDDVGGDDPTAQPGRRGRREST